MQDLTVLMLAGGDSDRFWPLADKHSLSFLGRPLAYYHLSQLRKFGFKNIVVVVNNQNESIFNNLRNEFSDLTINLIKQTDPRGMAGAIISAKKYIKAKKLLIVSCADIYEDLLLSTFIKELNYNPDGLITGIRQDKYFPGGYLKIAGDKVISIVEKPTPQNTPSNIVTIVFDYFRNADLLCTAISQIADSSDDIFEKAIDNLIKKDVNFKFLPYNGFWGFLKFPWDTLNIMFYFLHKAKRKKIKKAFIHESAVISGDVFIEDGVRILENTKIVGPAYIGTNTVIGQNCLIRESMIGQNCVVGFSTEIARSYVGDSCWFHSNYVGDSVIATNVSMGAGTVLANYKLSEGTIKSLILGKKIDTGKVKLGSMIGSGTRIGINSSIMPGVKIGKNCFVGPAVLLDSDLADDKSCKLVDLKYEIIPNKIILASDSRKINIKSLKLS